MSTTKKCNTRISKLIDHYNALAGLSRADGAKTSLADLIADIMHFCTQQEIDFDVLLRRANNYFADELHGPG
jgi:hypothetical protein